MEHVKTIFGSVAILAFGISAVSAAPRADVARDPRLQQRLSLQVPGRSMAAFLRQASMAAGVPLTAETECGDQKLIVEARSARLGEVLSLVEKHFQFRWEPVEPDRRDRRGPGYRLVMSGERRGLAGRLRAASEEGTAGRALRRLQLSIRALDASPEELRAIRAADKSVADAMVNLTTQKRVRLAALLPEPDLRALAQGRPFVSSPLSTLSVPLQTLVIEAASLRRYEGDPGVLRYRLQRETQDGADAVMFWVIGPDSRPVGHGGGVTPGNVPRREAGTPITRYATHPSRRPSDPKLQPVAELRDDAGVKLSVSAGLPSLLSAFSAASGLDVISDFYQVQPPRFDREPLGERPLWQLLNLITEQYSLQWERKGSFLLLRHREWYLVEPEEIPERMLERWRTPLAPAPRVSPVELLDVLGDLTPPQLAALGMQFPGAGLRPPYAWVSFLGALGPDERKALLAGRTLPLSEISGPARQRLDALAARLPPAASRPAPNRTVRLQTSSDALLGSVDPASKLKFRTPLPAKQTLLPPVRISPSRSR